MQKSSRQLIIQALHESRLRPYIDASHGNEKLALSLYKWHMELTASVQQVLGVTEVVLRNSMDAQLRIWNKQEGGTEKWLLTDPEAPLRSLTQGKRTEALKRAESEAYKRQPGHQRYGQQPHHDDVLAQVTFGMWKELLPNHAPNASAEATENKNRQRLWRDALVFAFPQANDSNGCKTYWRVVHIHHLRNRVAHMEPLLTVDVQDKMRDAFDLVRSIEPVVADWLTGASKVSQVLKQRPEH